MMQAVSADLLSSCDLESPIRGSECVDTDEFEAAFLSAAAEVDSAGNSEQALVYRLLAALCTFHFKPKDPAEPFSNRVGFSDGARSLVGSDLDAEQIVALGVALTRLTNVALHTRIADLIWTRDKSRSDCARLAIDGYVELVRRLVAGTGTERFHSPDPTGVGSQEFLERACAIARSTGWAKAENDALRTTLAEVLTIAASRDDMSVARIGRIATDVHLEAADSILEDMPSLVDDLLAKSDFFVAEGVQRLIIRRARRSNDDDVIRNVTLKLTSIFEAKADGIDSAMLKTHALQEAIDSLHGIKGVRTERQRLHDKLKEAQLHMFEEFGKFEHSVDLTDEVQRILSGYDDLAPLDCLLRLAHTELPRDPEELEKRAREEAQKFPLSSLFPASLVDGKGRTVARTKGGFAGDEALRYQIIKNESIRIGLAVAGAINPAREYITQKYTVDQDLLYELCLISPFVPSGTEHAFAKGIQAFLYGDEFVATAALVPLLEAGMRAMVEAAGRSDTKISAGGIEATIGLGLMLADHRDVLEAVFSKGIVFSVENLFVHELGPKVRHSFCHGLTSDDAFYSREYVYANKLIFSLVLLPLGGQGWDKVKAHIEGKLGTTGLP
ncbi:MAG: hypothetical protein V4444_08155 [Pseudomonadota bacterium]